MEPLKNDTNLLSNLRGITPKPLVVHVSNFEKTSYQLFGHKRTESVAASQDCHAHLSEVDVGACYGNYTFYSSSSKELKIRAF